MASTDDIAHELRRRIDRGEWLAGVRVPPERLLAEEFAAARNTVRRALAELEDEGLLARHVGRGTFVQSHNEVPADTFLARMRNASPADVMEVRLIIEPRAAALAASRASAADLGEIDTALRHSLLAKGLAEFEHWDSRLHRAIFKATKNAVLLDYCEAINEVRNQPRWYRLKKRSLTDERRYRYDQHHTAIVAALKDRDAEATSRHMRMHIEAVQENLLDAPESA